MFETYVPKKFCREFVDAKGNSLQLSMIMATVAGIKPAMDDWVPVERVEAYRKACKKYGIFMETDAVFQIIPGKSVPANSAGRELLTTTKALGAPYTKKTKKGSVHVFLSRSRERLRSAFSNGWYPIIIKDRVVDRPLADTFRFGYHLGYPSCCVRFFHSHNDWFRFNTLHEAFINSKPRKPVFFCNPFNKDVTYSYIYHMPCSYHCQETAAWASRARDAIRSEEPRFARLVDKHLKRPYLVFREQKYYAFEGAMKNNRLFYKKIFFTGGVRDNDLHGRELMAGDCLFIEARDVVILKKGRAAARIKAPDRTFGREMPFLIDFS